MCNIIKALRRLEIKACLDLLVFPPTVVRAVTAGQKLTVGVEINILLRKSVSGILHVLGEAPINRVDAGDGHVLLAIAQVLDGAELPTGFEFVVNMEPPVKVEEVNLEFRLDDTGKFQGNLRLKLKFLTCDKSRLTLNIDELQQDSLISGHKVIDMSPSSSPSR